MPRLLELFSGTGSIGKAFAEAGWEVVSLDMDPKAKATITADFMQWDYRCYEFITPHEGCSENTTTHFDCIWASPPCTHYSIARTTAKTPRDLEGSDLLVQRVLDCIAYFKPKTWFFENPQTGYLKGRRVVEGLRYKDVSYCVFGFPYRKPTRIWTNLDDWEPAAMCTRACPCEVSRETGRHPMTAQRAPTKVGGVRRPSCEDKCTQDQLYSMPPALCAEICNEATRALSLP
jgi:hypothetical protein